MSTNNSDDIVYVPIPQHLLSTFYRIFPTVVEEAARQEQATEPFPNPELRKFGMIDLIIEAAYKLGADHHPISLKELHAVYMHANPGIGKGRSRNSFDATVNFHCINMRSRFPEFANKQRPASWLTRPTFKRVSRGRFMLLSPDETESFKRLIEEGDPRIYEEEYMVEDIL